MVLSLALTAWAAVTTLVSASFLASHLLTLPLPDQKDPRLAAAVADVTPNATWSLLHALSSECRCSAAVLEHLMTTERPPGVTETVVLVGPPGDIEARVRAKGFGFVSLTAEELDSRYHIPAVPVLVIADPSGTIRYSGGYTPRKQGPEVQDLAILGEVRRGETPDSLPLFGCPVNTALRDSLTPIGLR